jgi:hypothetical protein
MLWPARLMMLRVKASDVLDANAVVRRRFKAKVLGYFRRVGPNRWDDYAFVRDDQGEIDVLAGVRVQLERRALELRLRSKGRVLKVRPALGSSGDCTAKQRRDRFVAQHLESFDDAPGLGTAAFVAKTLVR